MAAWLYSSTFGDMSCKESEEFPGDVLVFPNPFTEQFNLMLDHESEVSVWLVGKEEVAQMSFLGASSQKAGPVCKESILPDLVSF